jgi:Mechanosensitive ion channel, conserved TM helix
MQGLPSGQLAGFQTRVLDYLPTLTAGLVVLGLGLVVGWIAKRATVRALIWLRLDRLGGHHAWRAAFSKGDVRSALYNVMGTVVMVLVVLVFLDNALEIWGLVVLSSMVAAMLVYLPNLALVALIVGVGVFLANTLADRVQEALEEEELPRARLGAKIFQGALLFIVGALALWELNFAREIVLAAFLIAFGAVGVAFALGAGIGSARAVQRALDDFFARRDKQE